MDGINVLSLFDGISCGQLALQRAGIKYKNYYASEIKPTAIKVTQHHFPNTIQLGDVTKLDLNKLPPIDLLIGGSPCIGFSSAGKRLNFNDPRSALFFNFLKIKDQIKPKWFLLENVKMRKEWSNTISDYIGLQAVEINSALVSAQNRKRLYWTNIPNVELPVDKNINLKDIFKDKVTLYRLPHGYVDEQIKEYSKYPALVTQSPGFRYKIKVGDSEFRTLTPEECEILQTLPVGYTSILPKTHRYNVIGDGWTVDVISHILSYIK